MARATSIRDPKSWFGLLALVACLALFGCGTSSKPTAPGTPQGSTSLGLRAASLRCLPILVEGVQVDHDGELVIWRPLRTEDEAAIERDHNLETIGLVGAFFVSRSVEEADAQSILASLLVDPRVQDAELNLVADLPEARGHSWAFDDGILDATGYEDQGVAARLGLAEAHAATRGAGILVAVLDTGVNAGNPLLGGRVVAGYDFVDNDEDAVESPDGIDSDGDGVADEALGHGTHVAGIVALTAPDAQILPVRVLDSDGRGSIFAIARAIDYAVTRGARVVNLSVGVLTDSELLENAIQRASDQGVILIASAGNWGSDQPYEYPAHSPNVIAIAATDSSDAAASFTSYGSFVGLCAPGVAIRSSYWNGHTAVWSGTSMSAGFASGGAALALAIHPAWGKSDVLALFAQTAAPLQPGPLGLPTGLTAGRIDLRAALAPATTAEVPTAGGESGTSGSGTTP